MKIKIEFDTNGTGLNHDSAMGILKSIVEHAGTFLGDWPDNPIFDEDGKKIGSWSYDSLDHLDEALDIVSEDGTCEDCWIACNFKTGVDHEIADGVDLCSDCAQDVRDCYCMYCNCGPCRCEEIGEY